VNGVVAVVDGEALAAGHVVANPEALEAQRLADPSLDHATAIEELFEEQLEAADLVLVSRADSLDPAALAALQDRLRPSLRPGTPVLPMERGQIDPALVLGLTRPSPDQSHGAGDHDHDHHDHDHHDHTHVAMESLAINLPGVFDRERLEISFRALIASGALIRVKGRLWLPGKARPLQIQGVGPRLECWFEADDAPGTPKQDGLELVVLGFGLNQDQLESSLKGAMT
jgi:cobalamin biosynthesis protein CobW